MHSHITRVAQPAPIDLSTVHPATESDIILAEQKNPGVFRDLAELTSKFGTHLEGSAVVLCHYLITKHFMIDPQMGLALFVRYTQSVQAMKQEVL